MTVLWPWLLLGSAGAVLGLVLVGHARLFRDPPQWRSGGLTMTIRDGRVRYTPPPAGDEMTETPDILPGFQQMLRALAEPDGELLCYTNSVPTGVLEMLLRGLIQEVEVCPDTLKTSFIITDKGRDYVDRLG